ncbi:MAG TPA: nucleotidyltransferase domain-containing protein [Candidatus Bathyarchaeia archaeon]|nr:nucleotidyltransferase domain-containing protein [Candidatus Bathyarchaeia archaeon]
MTEWVPRDGDTFITRDNFVFYAFGYEHPKGRVTSFLKYIPAEHKDRFKIRFLDKIWKKGKLQLFRPEKLYTAENYTTFLEAFKKNFPEYVHHCPFRQKNIISVSLKQIKKVYLPNESLQKLLKKKRKDRLEKIALRLLTLLSRKSKVPLDDFGLHGSLALNIHTSNSDVDFVVYGAKNFRRVEKTVERLVKRKSLSYVFTKRLDMARRYRGKFKDTLFVYNAVRKPEEIKTKHGAFKYFPLKPVKLYCDVHDDRETMFRPAVYDVRNYVPIDRESILAENTVPNTVVSMIGHYRNIARKGDRIRASGMLERVERVGTGKTSFQVVVGTASSEDEYIWPL